MDIPKGTVVSVETRAEHILATIEVDSMVACPRCAEGRGCGAGLVSGTARLRRVDAVAAPDMELQPGDMVSVELQPGRLLNAALMAYGAPLLGAVLAAALAFSFRFGDAGTAAACLAGLGAGMLASRLYLRRPACLGDLRLTVGGRR